MVNSSDQGALPGRAALAMAAQDARWIGSTILSSTDGALSMSLLGHSARVVYEGRLALASRNTGGRAELVALLPAESSEAITRARHATKMLDDTKTGFADFLSSMGEYQRLHHAQFTGNAVWFARHLETDLGLYLVAGRVLSGTIPLQFRLGASPELDIEELGKYCYESAADQGRVLAVLARADGSNSTITPSANLSRIPPISNDDRDSARYLAHRYDPALPIEAKLLLLMIEGEATVSDVVLPETTYGHHEAVFRARMVSLFHILSSLANVLQTYPSALSEKTQTVRRIMNEDATSRFLHDPDLRKIRNRCMHYEMRGTALRLDSAAPMFGIVEALSDSTYSQLNEKVASLFGRISPVLSDW